MTPRNHALTAALLLLALALVAPARSAGPLSVTEGTPPIVFAWNTDSPVSFHCDQGTLGTVSNTDARNLVAELFQTWQDVSTAKITFVQGSQLAQDITAANVDTVLGQNDNINPIIFDTDGTVTDAVLGDHQSNVVLGFAGPELTQPATGLIVGGLAVLNGEWIDGVTNTGVPIDDPAYNPELPGPNKLEIYRGVFVHEFGHFINLDHSQINRAEVIDADPSNDESIPTMYPLVFGNSNEQGTLHRDDICSVSSIYPESSFASDFGTIEGTVSLPTTGTPPFQGMNVIARKVDDPLVTASSCVSGFLFQNSAGDSGTPDLAYQGKYSIRGLPPGNYTVEIESVDGRWADGSSVGPVNPPVFGGVTEYWNGFNEGADPTLDRPSERVVIPLSAGQTVSNVNFILNFSMGISQNFGPGDPLDNLDNRTLTFTPSPGAPGGYTVQRSSGGTLLDSSSHQVVPLIDDDYRSYSLPGTVSVYGAPYSTVNVCSNGFITFGRPAPLSVSNTHFTELDHTPTQAEHFGPRPHISGVYTDLTPTAAGNGVRIAYITSTGLVVTYLNVSVLGGGFVTFQIIVRPDGVITITYGAVVAGNSGAQVGISSGGTFSASHAVVVNYALIQDDITPPTVAINSPAGSTISGPAVTLSANMTDSSPSSGLKEMRFYVDGIQVGTTGTSTPHSATLDTTKLTNGDKRLEVHAWDRSGRRAIAAKVVTVSNAGRPSLSFSILNSSYNVPFVSFTLQITNNGPNAIDSGVLQDLWLEGTNGGTGVQRIYCNASSGQPLPRNLGGIPVGGSVSVPMVGYVPTGVTSIRRWVNRGTVTIGGSTFTF